MPARRTWLPTRKVRITVLMAMVIAVVMTLLTAFADDLLASFRANKPPSRSFAAGDRFIMARESRTSWSVLHISIYGDKPALSSAEIIALASSTPWSSDPLVATAALNFPRQSSERIVMLRGWPLRALHSWVDPRAGSALREPIQGAISVALAGREISIPYLPVWPGLLVNLALYTGLAWLGLKIPGWLRATIRSRRGQCIRCAYDLRDLPAAQPCPECGASSPNRTDQSQNKVPLSSS